MDPQCPEEALGKHCCRADLACDEIFGCRLRARKRKDRHFDEKCLFSFKIVLIVASKEGKL